MKKIVLIAAFALNAMVIVAQTAPQRTTLKPFAGLSYAAMFNGDLDFRKAIVAGAEIERPLARWVTVSAGLVYSPQGGVYNSSGTSFTWKHDYINIPIMANVYPLKGFALKVGLQPGISVSNRQEGQAGMSIVQNDMEGNLKPYDLAIPVGVSYELFNIVLDVRWNIGVISVGKSDPWAGDIYMGNSHLGGANFAYQFTLGYKFDISGDNGK
ncbi:MAG: outer membrane beta-barrel protein [Prevotella sp.]|nr:outer membrane beta-barrel protein [Prevotella sp.]